MPASVYEQSSPESVKSTLWIKGSDDPGLDGSGTVMASHKDDDPACITSATFSAVLQCVKQV